MTQINLLPWREEKREQNKKSFTNLLLGTFVSAAALVLLINQYASRLVDSETLRNQRLQNEITQLSSQIVEIKRLKELRDSLISRMRIVHGLQERRTLTLHLFDELIKVLPDGVYLTEVKRVEDKVTLQGFSESNSNVSFLMRNIQQNPWIHEPVLTEIKRADESKTSENNEFTLSFILKANTPLAKDTP